MNRRCPNGQQQFITYEIQLHIPYCGYSQIQAQSDVWANEERSGGILKKLCEMEGIMLIQGFVSADHVHMYASIPPKMSISKVMARLKGKSALMLFDRHPEYRDRFGRHFWARGYYVETVGNVNEDVIKKYIEEQKESDRIEG